MTDLKYYNEGDILYQDMLSAIRGAHHSIDLECYIFANDDLGKQFFKALISKADKGIQVRILLDSVGSERWFNRNFFNRIKKHQVQVRFLL